jgi:hypothetical protein
MRRNAFAFVGGVLTRVPYTSNDSSLNMRDLSWREVSKFTPPTLAT